MAKGVFDGGVRWLHTYNNYLRDEDVALACKFVVCRNNYIFVFFSFIFHIIY